MTVVFLILQLVVLTLLVSCWFFDDADKMFVSIVLASVQTQWTLESAAFGTHQKRFTHENPIGNKRRTIPYPKQSSISIPIKFSHKLLLLVPTFPSNEMFWNVTPVPTFHSGGEYGAVKKHVNCVASPARFLRACQYGGAIQGHTNVIWLSASNFWCNYFASLTQDLK